MSEREDVEALGAVFDRLSVPSWIRPALMDAIAAHVEAVRVSERVRLAGEVEALIDLADRANTGILFGGGRFPTMVSADALHALAHDRLTEEE